MKKILLLLMIGMSLAMGAQSIQSVVPNSGTSGQTLQVTITGNGTVFSQISGTSGASYYNGSFGQFDASSYEYISDTQIIANVTIPYFMPSGSYDLNIPTHVDWYWLDNAFTVVNTANTISGSIKVDANANGCDAADMPMAGIRVKLNDGTTDSFAFTNAAGIYTFPVPAGNFVVTPDPEFAYFSASPVSATVSFPTQDSLSETHDFCLSANGVHNDLEISVLPLEPARPGFNATYRLVCKNKGNQPLSGTMNLAFDDSRLDFVSAVPAVSSQSANNLTWNFANLLPFESRNVNLTLNVNSPMETPPVNINDLLPFTASVVPVSGDETPNDNTFSLNQVVVGSYDPNDKAVAEGDEINLADVGEYLHYLIRFQNSGTFAAENVVVRDMLASTLDKSTLQVTAASHPYRSSLTEGNKLEFFFENINLPPEITDEPGSHGFVAFKIKPAASVGLGSVIENTAEIYFDFNFPIITNTVGTTVTLLSTKDFKIADAFVMYPNPAGDRVHFQSTSLAQINSVRIFNPLGQLVKSISNLSDNSISVSDLTSGTYYLELNDGKSTSVKKLIKL